MAKNIIKSVSMAKGQYVWIMEMMIWFYQTHLKH